MAVGCLLILLVGFEAEITFNSDIFPSTLNDNPTVANFETQRGWIVCWSSQGGDGDGSAVVCQGTELPKNLLGPNLIINSWTADNQQTPYIAAYQDDVLAVWESDGQDGQDLGIYAQRLNIISTGIEKFTAEFHASRLLTSGKQSAPTVCWGNTNSFAVAYYSTSDNNMPPDGVYKGLVVSFFENYVFQSKRVIQVLSISAPEEVDIGIIDVAALRYIAVWVTASSAVQIEIFNSAASVSTTTMGINTHNPSVATAAGYSVIVWHTNSSVSPLSDTDGGIAASAITNSGILGVILQVNTYTANVQRNAHIAHMGGNKFMVTWESVGQDDCVRCIFARVLIYDPGPKTLDYVGKEFRVSQNTTVENQTPQVATHISDSLVIFTWRLADDSIGDIVGQTYSTFTPCVLDNNKTGLCSGSACSGKAQSIGSCLGGKVCCVTDYGTCVAGGLDGACMNASECIGTSTPGLCPGPTGIQCCTQPTATPTDSPTAIPTDTPTAIPTDTPTAIPTDTPTAIPTDTPTAIPTDTPTAIPTDTPTAIPTDTPTAIPTYTPTAIPTVTPTAIPTAAPTAMPTAAPTAMPTAIPTDTPTAVPTVIPALEAVEVEPNLTSIGLPKEQEVGAGISMVTGVALLGVTSIGGGASFAMRSVMYLDMLNCPEVDYTRGVMMNPTQITIGDDVHKHIRGSNVGNHVFLISICIICAIVCLVRRESGEPYSASLGRAPISLVIVMLEYFWPAIVQHMFLLLFYGNVIDQVISIILITVWAGLLGNLFRMSRVAVVKCDLKRTRFTSTVDKFMKPSHVWIEKPGVNTGEVEFLSQIFTGYKAVHCSYFFVSMSLLSVVSLISAWNPTTLVVCAGRAGILVAAPAVWFALLLKDRPFLRPFENVMELMLASLEVTFTIIAFWGMANTKQDLVNISELLANILLWMCVAKFLIDVIFAAYDTWVTRIERKKQVTTNLNASLRNISQPDNHTEMLSFEQSGVSDEVDSWKTENSNLRLMLQQNQIQHEADRDHMRHELARFKEKYCEVMTTV